MTACRTIAAALGAVGLSLGVFAPAALSQEDDAGPFAEALEFRSLGPHRGGRVTAVAGVPDDRMTFYMGATGGGVWKTENGGVTWEVLSDEAFGTGSVGAIAVAPSDPNVVVVGMGESPFRGVASSQGDGVYVSTDAGRSWRHAGLDASAQISAVVIDPADPERWLVAVQGDIWAPSDVRGVYLTENAGESWTQVLDGENDTTGAVDLKADPSNPRILYAAMWDHRRRPWLIRSGGSGSGLWKSTDGGESWEELTEDLPEEMGKLGVAPSPAQTGRVWAVIEAADGEGGVYRSDDGGESWTQTNDTRAVQQRSWYYMDIFADPNDANTVYVLSAPFLRSIDGGRTFTPIPNPHTDQHDLWINPNNSDWMILGNDGGATVSYDGGGTWSTQFNQPTGQFYRVNADARFPYRIYGGQQDNSTIALRNWSLDGSIGRDDYQSIGGCESAFVDFEDSPDVRYVYAGCYLGQITEFDLETDTTRDIGVSEELAFGVPPAEREHRFNWNAPIVVSDHDPDVVYHAGEAVFRTTDRGYSWSQISPDLTRDDPERQGPMGAPITNEVSENYNTVAYLAESPHDGDVLWAGSDDGLVHVTTDGGESWTNVTPRRLGESLINAIEISPHDPNRVYVVATRYKFGDREPRIYRTDDMGGSWTRIDRGLPEDESWFARVVREDPTRPGLLYAGTETGLYVSWNGGGDWDSLQLNLPRTPITDIKVHRGDLVLSTQGRGFWVLDSLSVIRGWNAEIAEADMHLFDPDPAVRYEGGGGTGPGDAANPPEITNALITYRLGAEPDLEEASLELEILDADGEVVRTLTADAETGPEGGGEGPGYHIPYAEGLNIATWDHRTDPGTAVPELFMIAGGENGVAGHRVAPGDYTVRLTRGETTLEAPLEVRWDPRLDVTPERVAEQQAAVGELYAMIDELHRSLVALERVKSQAETRKTLLEEADGDAALIESATEVIEAVEAWRDSVANFKREGFQDVLNWPDRLSTDLQLLYGSVDGAREGLTQGMRDRLAELTAEWEDAMTRRDALVAGEIAAFNAAFRDAGAEGLAVPAFTAEAAGEE